MPSKYIRLQWAGFVVWDAMAPLSHAQVAQQLAVPGDWVISAGFVERRGVSLVCGGESTSLGMRALPDDTEHLRAQLGLPCTPEGASA
jgi:hypothetical protein